MKRLIASLAFLALVCGEGHAAPLDEAGAAEALGDYATAIRIYRPLVAEGNAAAQASLGLMYLNGHGVAQDDAEAARLLRLAADKGNALGQASLAYMYETGAGMARDEQQAVKLYRLAADQGNAYAQTNLGLMYLEGRGGLARDEVAGAAWVRRAAEKGDGEAQATLGWMYEWGRGVDRDYGQAVRWYRMGAEQGLAGAQHNLGLVYENGKGVPKDDAQAFKLYRRAAEQGYAPAENSLGNMYATGRGVEKDYARALEWYTKAAKKGETWAEANLGAMYLHGAGVPKDDEQAIRWIRKAAEKSNSHAQVNLGYMYESGRGISKDLPQALDWYRKAADQGDAEGQLRVGLMYQRGRGVAKDDAKALQWMRKAADAGSTEAQKNLGFRYREGWGVPEDLPEALKWMRLAAEKDDAEAKEFVAKIEREALHTGVPVPPAPEKPPSNPPQPQPQAIDIVALVKSHDNASQAWPKADAERMALVAKLVEATRAKQKLSHIGRDLDQLPASLSTTSFSRLQEASRDTAIATFTADRILPVLERKLAEQLDEATLRAGLDWELSETGRLINRLEAEMPEQQVAFKEFVRQLVEKGGRVTDPRARSCSQVDILRNQTEAALPLMEALGAAEAMSMFIQKQMPLDTAAIQSAIVSMRPLLREIGRLSVLAECLFALKEVSDADFEKWLEFLRSDAGGKYARAASAAMRDALLARAEVYTQVMLEVARRLKDRNEI